MSYQAGKIIATPVELYTCSLEVKDVTADTIAVKYKGLPGNQPNLYENYVSLWPSATIPWNITPIKHVLVPGDNEQGDFVIHGLTIKPTNYTLGYGVGNMISDICTCAQILSVDYMEIVPYTVTISISRVDTNSITLNYVTLPGYLPGFYQNWVGLWEGFASPYFAVPPLGQTVITSNASQGSAGITNVTIDPNAAYTLIYFMGPLGSSNWPQCICNAAAMLYFTTS
ncbi:hypothetical protein [Chitinophaga flava]|uniref:Uncharacterized protein n=1 Tax=Chitinophaga flava TaxID=2259036 RepID=A0A365XSG4_9BACT|nr:hypothetical protein [Chitinophaga flava]RBL89316.1 hypothetical protein DF182_22605 [Chitinophaga flava]